MSHASASSIPPPITLPCKAAMMGLVVRCSPRVIPPAKPLLSILRPRSGPPPVQPSTWVCKSAPAQNAFSPFPDKMASRTSGSSRNRVHAWNSCSSTSLSMALSLSGRFSVMKAISSRFSYSTFGSAEVMSLPSTRGPELVTQDELLNLPDGRNGQFGHEFDSLGNLPDGQLGLVGQVVPHFFERDFRGTLRHDDGADSFADCGIGHADHGHVRDLGMSQQGLFHLSRADVESTADDDVLQPSGNPEVAVLVQPTQIAGTPPALVVRGRGREIGPAPVFEHPARTAVADLAVLARADRLIVVADDADLDARNGPSVGRGDPLHGIFRAADGRHHRLARSVCADDATPGELLRRLLDQSRRNGRARGQPEAQP